MSFTDIYQISGSAMTAQTLRLNTVASNLANANAPASSEAQAYKARSPVFAAVYHHSLLAGTHRHAIDGASVQVQDVLQTGGAVKRYEPHSPLADANGDVWYPDQRGGTDGGHDVGLARFRNQCRCAQQREKYAAKFAETGRSLMNTLALNAQSPQPTATAESNNVAASDTQSSSDSSPVDTFLTLFVAEIQNQDPTDPTDATEYIDQLSSMAQVAMMEEMSVQANTNAVLMSNIQVMALGNLVGDDIMVQTTALQVSDQTINGRATLDDACTTADLHFTDAAGDDYTVSLIPQGSSSVGPGQVDFSVNPADYGIPPGDYDVSVVTNTGEEEVPIEVSGEVEDVRIPLDGSSPVLNVAGVGEVPFTMISQFGVPDADSDVA